MDLLLQANLLVPSEEKCCVCSAHHILVGAGYTETIHWASSALTAAAAAMVPIMITTLSSPALLQPQPHQLSAIFTSL